MASWGEKGWMREVEVKGKRVTGGEARVLANELRLRCRARCEAAPLSRQSSYVPLCLGSCYSQRWR